MRRCILNERPKGQEHRWCTYAISLCCALPSASIGTKRIHKHMGTPCNCATASSPRDVLLHPVTRYKSGNNAYWQSACRCILHGGPTDQGHCIFHVRSCQSLWLLWGPCARVTSQRRTPLQMAQTRVRHSTPMLPKKCHRLWEPTLQKSQAPPLYRGYKLCIRCPLR